MWVGSVPLHVRRWTARWAFFSMNAATGLREEVFSLAMARVQAHLTIWCPVLDSLVQGTLEHIQLVMRVWSTQCTRRNWENWIFVWPVPDSGGERYYFVVFSDLVGGWGEEGARLFSQVQSDRLRSNRDKLQHRKFLLDMWKGILPWDWSDTWTDCLDKLGNLHPCRLSKLHWVRLWIAWSSWTRFEWEAGLDDLQSFLLIYIILWFCGGIKAVKVTSPRSPENVADCFKITTVIYDWQLR